MSDAPTQRFDAQPPAPSGGNREKSRLPLILGIIGGILLLAIIIILIVILVKPGSGTNSALITATNTPTSSATVTATVPPATPTTPPTTAHTTAPPPPVQSTNPAFTTFITNNTVKSCSSGPFSTPVPIPIQVTWATVRASSAWIIQGTDDAADAKFMQIPLKGNQTNFPYEIDYGCSDKHETYTITLVGTNGKHVSHSWTITNTNPNG